MKNTSKSRRHHGFRKPRNPVKYLAADGLTRVQHGVVIDQREYDYAVNIASLRDVSLTYYFSTLLKEAIEADVHKVLAGLK